MINYNENDLLITDFFL